MPSFIRSNFMAKTGRDKNTKNKAKHSKLMAQKISKKKTEGQLRKERLKAIINKANQDKNDI
ncbi:hypothetical protein CSW08_03240 [Confluentibacter flavum]|uniref:Uncharacterized protein n=2 Tax=Confluentibacter flavum TaxID=1909700 RepID=A0A2N3HMQ3_9FLAO|nr:hypothetical protein CSW08_03240 [Confluentibacter flavum]